MTWLTCAINQASVKILNLLKDALGPSNGVCNKQSFI